MICAYLDVEGTKTDDWTGDTIGVDTNNWLYAQPSGLEECLEMAHQMQKDGEFDFYFEDTPIAKAGEIDTFKEVVVAGMNYGVIERAGSWFKFHGENIAQGADNTVIYLRENPEVSKQVKDELFSIVEREANTIP